jgi:hypothetical protein
VHETKISVNVTLWFDDLIWSQPPCDSFCPLA